MGVVVGNEIVGRRAGVFVGATVEMAVCMISASLIAGVAGELLQDASTAARNKRARVLPKMFIVHHL